MSSVPFFVIAAAAILSMALATFLVFKLRSRIPGGASRKAWNTLAILIGVFCGAYLATPAFPWLPVQVKELLVAGVFFLGALFVIIVVRLFGRILDDLGM